MIWVFAPKISERSVFMAQSPRRAADVAGTRLRPSPPPSLALDRDPKIANNQLIFPDEKFTENCTIQVSPEDEQAVDEAFESVLTG